MQLSPSPTGRELFFVLEDFCEQLFPMRARLVDLSRFVEAMKLAGVDALYQRERDLTLLCLRFDARQLDSDVRSRVVDEATEVGIPVIDPQRFADSDRRLFYQRYLRGFTVRVDDRPSPYEAVDALGKLLGYVDIEEDEDGAEHDVDIDSEQDVVTSIGSPTWDPARNQHPPEETDIPLILLPPQEHARGSGSHARLDPEQEGVPSHQAMEPTEKLGGSDPIQLGPAGKHRRREPLAPPARGKGKRSERVDTIPATPASRGTQKPPRELPLPPFPRMRGVRATSSPPRRARASAPPLPRPSSAPSLQDPEQDGVRVRFQRGDSWMPARLRNLSTKEVRLAASAAPPLGHSLRVSVTIGDYGLVISGTVVEVVNAERSVDGSTSFRLELRNLSKRERERLVELLRLAQREKISLTPPPPRRNRRFAISWPLAVVSEGHRFNAAALDISERGLFMATTTLIRSHQVVFGIPLDTGQAKVQGRARVARRVTEQMARERGLARGYGLQIEGLSESDQKQFESFLHRVVRRSQQHVVVAGSGRRCASLADCFQAAGYAVSKASSVETLMRRNHFEASTPDIAVLDESALDAGDRVNFEATFQDHQVPILRLNGQALQAARDILDRMIEA